MTRAEILNDIIRITNQDYEAVRRMKAHDQAQREEIARLREALGELVGQVVQAREGFGVYRNSPSMATVLVQAQAALAKEATRDTAK